MINYITLEFDIAIICLPLADCRQWRPETNSDPSRFKREVQCFKWACDGYVASILPLLIAFTCFFSYMRHSKVHNTVTNEFTVHAVLISTSTLDPTVQMFQFCVTFCSIDECHGKDGAEDGCDCRTAWTELGRWVNSGSTRRLFYCEPFMFISCLTSRFGTVLQTEQIYHIVPCTALQPTAFAQQSLFFFKAIVMNCDTFKTCCGSQTFRFMTHKIVVAETEPQHFRLNYLNFAKQQYHYLNNHCNMSTQNNHSKMFCIIWKIPQAPKVGVWWLTLEPRHQL